MYSKDLKINLKFSKYHTFLLSTIISVYSRVVLGFQPSTLTFVETILANFRFPLNWSNSELIDDIVLCPERILLKFESWNAPLTKLWIVFPFFSETVLAYSMAPILTPHKTSIIIMNQSKSNLQTV